MHRDAAAFAPHDHANPPGQTPPPADEHPQAKVHRRSSRRVALRSQACAGWTGSLSFVRARLVLFNYNCQLLRFILHPILHPGRARTRHLFHHIAKSRAGSKDATLDRSYRDSQHLCNLLIRQTSAIAQNQYRSLLGVEFAKRRQDSLTFFLQFDVRGPCRFPTTSRFLRNQIFPVPAPSIARTSRRQAVQARMPTQFFRPQFRQTHVHRYADHPRAQFAATIKRINAPNTLDKRILRQIRRHFAVSHHAKTHAKQPILIFTNKCRPRRRIATANALDNRQIARVRIARVIGAWSKIGRLRRQGPEVTCSKSAASAGTRSGCKPLRTLLTRYPYAACAPKSLEMN